ncbi:MAG: hypothetical protein ACI3XE_05985 [Eubacteriales bacterium]
MARGKDKAERKRSRKKNGDRAEGVRDIPLLREGVQGRGETVGVKNIRKLWLEEGVPVLELVMQFPETEGLPASIGAYYDALAAAFIENAERELYPTAREAYLRDPSPAKRFSFRRFRLKTVCTALKWKNCLSVTRKIEWSAGGEKKRVTEGEVFSLPCGHLVPLSCFLSRRTLRRIGRRERVGRIPRVAAFALSETGDPLLFTPRGSLLLSRETVGRKKKQKGKKRTAGAGERSAEKQPNGESASEEHPARENRASS